MLFPPAIDELGHLLATEAKWREAGHRTAIATVIQTWGSGVGGGGGRDMI